MSEVMMARSRDMLRRAWCATGVMSLVAMPLLVHMALRDGRWAAVAGVVAAAQLGGAVLVFGRAVPYWPRLGVAAALAALFLIASQLALQASLVGALFLGHATLYGGLFLLFGLSLRPGREPLVTTLATCSLGTLTPDLRLYTRSVTQLWTLFGIAQIAVSVLLLTCAPLLVWSVFVTMLDLPLVLLTFAAEYAVRCWRFPDRGTPSLLETLRLSRERLLAKPAADR